MHAASRAPRAWGKRTHGSRRTEGTGLGRPIAASCAPTTVVLDRTACGADSDHSPGLADLVALLAIREQVRVLLLAPHHSSILPSRPTSRLSSSVKIRIACTRPPPHRPNLKLRGWELPKPRMRTRVAVMGFSTRVDHNPMRLDLPRADGHENASRIW
ncbi:hypothetical protein BD309DRAFT_3229 [Dichomitus squalens]|nr:hypothetical protein BD309DRAFT_3229 [Dichomitus squalens]